MPGVDVLGVPSVTKGHLLTSFVLQGFLNLLVL